MTKTEERKLQAAKEGVVAYLATEFWVKEVIPTEGLDENPLPPGEFIACVRGRIREVSAGRGAMEEVLLRGHIEEIRKRGYEIARIFTGCEVARIFTGGAASESMGVLLVPITMDKVYDEYIIVKEGK